jgi:hypothetical protein
MSSNYFNKFPKILYDVNNDGTLSVQVDITKTVDINTIDEDRVTYYTFYEIQDGDRPDNISYSLYGTVQYYWTFFVINDSLKAGLNNSWPLNSHAFELMMVNEYDPYSAITFDPVLTSLLDSNGFLTIEASNANFLRSDFSVVPLVPVDNGDSYLPYLRLSPFKNEKGLTAKILKYDNNNCQLVIYDIKDKNNKEVEQREDFWRPNEFEYVLSWNNPYSVGTLEYQKNEVLKKRYVREAASYFEKIDKYNYPGRTSDPEIDPKYSNDDAGFEAYIFQKRYKRVPDSAEIGPWTWALYRNAIAQYTIQTTVDDQEKITNVSAFDVLYPKSNSAGSTIGRISFYQKEENINDEKRIIKAVRPDRIRQFSDTYFRLINS